MPDAVHEYCDKVGVPASKVLPCGDDWIVLLDYYQASGAKVLNNLVRLKPDGGLVWRICSPRSGDTFTNIEWRDGRLAAWTWQGYSMAIDHDSGRASEVVFTK